jgi:ABC-type xylose transport system permease subunit
MARSIPSLSSIQWKLWGPGIVVDLSGMLRFVGLLACMTPGDTAGPSAEGVENASEKILQTPPNKSRGAP